MIHIIYNNFLTPDGECFSVGGIQTYLKHLIAVLDDMRLSCCIHQRADVDFVKEYAGHVVYGYKIDKDARENKHLVKKALAKVNIQQDRVIFGCESCAVTNPGVPAIGIQHGVSWDKLDEKNKDGWRAQVIFLRKVLDTYDIIKRLSRLDNTVCVDYNFVNWFKAQIAFPKTRFTIIPNFTEILSSVPVKPKDKINIIFARRFFPYRGTRIFAEAISRILCEYGNVSVTIAGSGPDEEYLHEHIVGHNVNFIKYNSEESMKIHKDMHISVVPTTGSEGTSLSLLEGMGCGCVPICTYVGGMSNIVIDRYNGLIVRPESASIYSALKSLLDNPQMIPILANRAYETAKFSFNSSLWKKRWESVISDWLTQNDRTR